jgi:hypothetical protein
MDEPDIELLIKELAKTGADPFWVAEAISAEQEAAAAARSEAVAGSRRMQTVQQARPRPCRLNAQKCALLIGRLVKPPIASWACRNATSRANNRVGFSARAPPLMVPLVVRLAGGLKRQARWLGIVRRSRSPPSNGEPEDFDEDLYPPFPDR